MANDKLQKWALTAEIISAVAIIITLVFVGLQLRDNTRATRSATANAASAATSAWYTALGNNEQSSALFWKYQMDPDALTSEQRLQAVFNIHAILLTFQNNYYLAEEGTLDIQIHQTIMEAIVAIKDLPGWQHYWTNRRAFFFSEFQDYVDTLMTSERKVSEGMFKEIKPQ